MDTIGESINWNNLSGEQSDHKNKKPGPAEWRSD